ncbi:MAG TPA: sodium:proton antiporter [Pseudonocardiaceae bacterium]|nr:sodium:proton antiporter [Pseudonocardiaceae bacterium]
MRAIQLLLVVVGAIAVAALAHRRGLQPALVMVILASAVSFIPGLPRFELQPSLILGVVLPPLLYSAALDFSFVSFARNIRPIISLGVGMVVVSTFVTGLVAWWVVPGLALVPALVLGAVVAPPDAVAALAVGRRLGLPRQLMAILTGESLVNDASALTIFTLAVAAVTGVHTFVSNPVLLFGYEVVAGCLIGMLLGVVVHWIRLRLRESGLETALGLVVPFAAYLLAEEIHASGVLAVVMAGFYLGHNNMSVGFETRLQDRQVWRSLDTLLETFVFAYMGLQCRFIFSSLTSSGISWPSFVLVAVVVLLAVLLVRPVWVFITYGRDRLGGKLLRRIARMPRFTRKLARRNAKRVASGRDKVDGDRALLSYRLPWRYVVVISWTGMRGVVTLAAAAGIPALTSTGAPFPHRDVIQALAFVVAGGTLLIQGPTLPSLIRRLDISAPEERRREAESVRRARQIVRVATEQTMTEIVADPPEGVDPLVLAKFRDRINSAIAARRPADDADEEAVAAQRNSPMWETTRTLRRTMLAAQRKALSTAGEAGEVDDEVVRRELERLDYEEAAAWSSTGIED